MKTQRWLGAWVMTAMMGRLLSAQVGEPLLPRPGAVIVAEVTGDVSAGVGDQRKPVKAEERLRVGSTITSGRMSVATVTFSNGVIVNLGSESELEIEEFGQLPVSGSLKIAELKEEPTISRTQLRLLHGHVAIQVKPLKVTRGSSFMLAIPAGILHTGEGSFRAMTRMSDLGLGVCTLELEKGAAEFELTGGTFSPVPVGRQLAFAIEIDKNTGVPKIGEMPTAPKEAAAK